MYILDPPVALPSKQIQSQIQKEIEEYLNPNLPKCFDYFVGDTLFRLPAGPSTVWLKNNGTLSWSLSIYTNNV